MADVYRFRLPDGQEHAWHGSVSDLHASHEDAVVLGQLVLDDLGQGTWTPYAAAPAPAARERKATDEESAAPDKPKKDGK